MPPEAAGRLGHTADGLAVTALAIAAASAWIWMLRSPPVSPAWMAALALTMRAEKTRAGRAVALTAGVVFVVAAGLRLAI